ncbi:MAG: c-type cytochrome biogenesis protein CcmI, partial [Burkholderiales bacterium]
CRDAARWSGRARVIVTALVFAGGALLAVGVAFVVVPLLGAPRCLAFSGRTTEIAALYREQLAELERDRETGLLAPEHYERAAAELKRRMLQDVAPDAPGDRPAAAAARVPRWALPAVIGVAMPLAAVALYLQLGAPRALEPAASTAPAQMTAQDIEAMVERLAARMKESPNDARGWAMLGRSYLMLARYAESSQAYERALALSPNDLDLLTSLAGALRMADPGASARRVGELAARALAIDPDHPAALAFAGVAAYESGQHRAAIAHWERLLPLLPPESELAGTIRERLGEARSKLTGTPGRKQ